jgi:hypothetical protein
MYITVGIFCICGQVILQGMTEPLGTKIVIYIVLHTENHNFNYTLIMSCLIIVQTSAEVEQKATRQGIHRTNKKTWKC